MAEVETIDYDDSYQLTEMDKKVLAVKDHYKSYWLDENNSYWFYKVLQEFGELGSVLANDHNDSIEHELIQISAICINWLEKLKGDSDINGISREDS